MPATVVERVAQLLLVRRSELRHAGYFAGFYLVLGIGLALGRGSADALFFKRYGLEYLPVVYMIHAGLLLGTTAVYAMFADRIPAERLFRTMLAVLGGALALVWCGMMFTAGEIVYPLYYLLYELASDLLVLHLGVYIVQNFETLQTQRLTPLIFAGAQLGIILGGLLLAFGAGAIGVPNLLLWWAGLLAAALLALHLRHRRYGPSPYFRPGRKGRHALIHALGQVTQGLRFARDSALMRWSSLALFFTVFTFYIGSYAVNRIYTARYQTEEELTAFFGWLTMGTSLLALLMQLLLTGRLLRRIGVRGVNLIFPTSTVASFALLLASFSLPAALVASINKDALLKAFRNPVRSLLFNALPGYIQGRSRALATGFVLPVALALTGGLLLWTQSTTGTTAFLIAGAVAALAYLYCNLRANRAYSDGVMQLLRDQLYVRGGPADAAARVAGPQLLAELGRGVAHPDDDIACQWAQQLVDRFPAEAPAIVLERLERAQPPARDRMVRLLLAFDSSALRGAMWRELERGDDHLRGTILEWLMHVQEPMSRERIETLLMSPNPRIAAIGIHAVQQYRLVDLAERARAQLAQLLAAGSSGAAVAGLEQLQRNPEPMFEPALRQLLQHADTTVRRAAVQALTRWPETPHDLALLAGQALRDPEVAVRRVAVPLCAQLARAERRELTQHALEDLDARVRQQAVMVLVGQASDGVAALLAPLRSGAGSPRAHGSLLSALLAAEPAAALLDEMAAHFARQAQVYASWRQQLQNQSGAALRPQGRELMLYVFEERARDMVGLALDVIGYREGAERVQLVRAGLDSPDRRHVASAREALRGLGTRELMDVLTQALELLDAEPGTPAAGERRQRPDLTHLAAAGDPWLGACARWAFGLQVHTEERAMADLFGRILLLKQSGLFAQVETEHLRAIAAELAEEAFISGERVFDRGEPGDRAYVIERGRVGISIHPDPARPEFIATLGPGELFGEMNLFDHLTRSATAHVLEDARLLSLEVGKLRGLIISYPELSLGLLRGLSLRVRAMNARAIPLDGASPPVLPGAMSP